jgi:hypothetical protein
MSALGVRWEDAQGPLPSLSLQAERAVHCWGWCGGWHPERWPMYAALHDVSDWAAMSELMQTIRDEQAKPETAQ